MHLSRAGESYGKIVSPKILLIWSSASTLAPRGKAQFQGNINEKQGFLSLVYVGRQELSGPISRTLARGLIINKSNLK